MKKKKSKFEAKILNNCQDGENLILIKTGEEGFVLNCEKIEELSKFLSKALFHNLNFVVDSWIKTKEEKNENEKRIKRNRFGNVGFFQKESAHKFKRVFAKRNI